MLASRKFFVRLCNLVQMTMRVSRATSFVSCKSPILTFEMHMDHGNAPLQSAIFWWGKFSRLVLHAGRVSKCRSSWSCLTSKSALKRTQMHCLQYPQVLHHSLKKLATHILSACRLSSKKWIFYSAGSLLCFTWKQSAAPVPQECCYMLQQGVWGEATLKHTGKSILYSHGTYKLFLPSMMSPSLLACTWDNQSLLCQQADDSRLNFI